MRTATLILAALIGSPIVQAKPNVVLILADDLGYGELGCYGQSVIRTPNLDRLAASGMKFTQFYSGAPVCAPSRCVLLTGMHSGHAFIRDNREQQPEGQLPIPDDAVTLAERLQSLGYATAAIGKWGLGHPGSSGDPNRQGFDLFFGFNCQRHAHNHYPDYLWRNDQRISLPGAADDSAARPYAQDLFTQEALQFIRDHAQEPFFLYLPFTIPHLSIQVPDASLVPYGGVIPEADYDHRDGYRPHPTPRAGYAAMVSHMDAAIGRIIGLLDELQLADNTLVIFSSDNGPTMGRLGGADSDFFRSAGLLHGRKGSVDEGGIRVPLIARWPNRIPAGQVTDHVGAFWDLVPTVLEAVGAATPAGLDGISLLPTLRGAGEQPDHPFLVWHFPGYGGQQAIRIGSWKGVRRELIRHPDAPLQLYRLDQDLTESHNVAADHPEIVAQMMELLGQTQSPSEDFVWLGQPVPRD